ncbi:hypothetical protein [Gloeothece verrucosa]|uniref:Uncharacterized protein n=1 Tax=Gloeothece verrucosa (strain PCC 7822) TaxID=497965 RepID=E0U5W4_GLOV7|nr:hypothetical protein [Gloeothece verrucosa]ADN15955.1 conserved hypothetical protein [Gloeothece verrucosa PCC 7822]
MTENTQLTDHEPITDQELGQVIAELEQYRERLVNETLTTAQRAKLPKNKALAQLEPLLAQIDNQLQILREQKASHH